MAAAVETRAKDYLAAIAHLPSGGTLSFPNIPWEEYEELKLRRASPFLF